MFVRLFSFVLPPAFLLVGCATTTAEELARDRAAREYNCPSRKVRTLYLSHTAKGAEVYKVAACGNVTTYACDETELSCESEGHYSQSAGDDDDNPPFLPPRTP
jgi:hypothetical protein